MPKATPTRPKFWARFSGGEMSAMQFLCEPAGEEEPAEAGREGEEEEGDAEPELGRQQHRAPAEAVGKAADQGRAEELHRRVERDQGAEDPGGVGDVAAAQGLDQLRQDRHQQAEAEDVDDQDGEDEGEARRPGSGPHPVSSHQAGVWSEAFSSARGLRSTPEATSRSAAWGESSRWSMRSPRSRCQAPPW
jgi:hypothetical protein